MQAPNITRAHSAFSLVCRVVVDIEAPAERIWRLLTTANDVARWNSTVTSIEGDIVEGERIRLKVPGTDRVFTPRISGVVPCEKMTWTGGFAPMFKGVRTFELTPGDGGSTR